MSPVRPDVTEKSLRVLVVGSDRVLEEEVRSALAGVPGRQGVVTYAEDDRAAMDAARRRQPSFVVVEIDRDVSDILPLIADLRELAPEAAIAGAYRPDRLSNGTGEGSTLIPLFRAEVRDFLRRPVSTTELRGVLDRLFATRVASTVPEHGRVAAFVSSKGGVGKSVLAVNVACGLAQRYPDDVLLIDASLQAGACALMLNVPPATTVVDAAHERDRLDKTLLRHLSLRHSSGLRVLAAPVDVVEAAEVDEEVIGRILNLARRAFRHVVVDTSAALDGVLMAILDLADVVFVVGQGTAPAVAGTARLLPVLDGLGVSPSRQRVVLNGSYKPFLGDLHADDVGERIGRMPDYVVPYDSGVLVSMNTGSPRLLHARRWQRFGREVNRIVDDLDGDVGALADGSTRLRESGEPTGRGAAGRSPDDIKAKLGRGV